MKTPGTIYNHNYENARYMYFNAERRDRHDYSDNYYRNSPSNRRQVNSGERQQWENLHNDYPPRGHR